MDEELSSIQEAMRKATEQERMIEELYEQLHGEYPDGDTKEEEED